MLGLSTFKRISLGKHLAANFCIVT